MKIIAIILLASCLMASAQSTEQQRDQAIKQAAGYRKVGDKVYFPAYSTNWFVLPDSSNPAWLKVNQILDDGITADFTFVGNRGTAIQKTIFIKNFPGKDALATGATLNGGNPIVAMRNGVYKASASSVLEAYDYGVACAKP